MKGYDPAEEFDPRMKRKVTTFTGRKAQVIAEAINSEKAWTWYIKFKAGRMILELWSE
ncbi:MAG: hypothetical protein ABI348_11075 [Nitrososphaera sp.]